MAITWDAHFELGIASIDAHHKRLVELVTRLADSFESGKSQGELRREVSDVVSYMTSHTQHEDQLMVDHGYSDIKKHRQKHTDLLGQAASLQAKATEGNLMVTSKTVDFLQEWLLHHMDESDKELARFLRTEGVQ